VVKVEPTGEERQREKTTPEQQQKEEPTLCQNRKG
jgi:hypothetical protein